MTTLIFTNARLIDPETGTDSPGWLHIANGLIDSGQQATGCRPKEALTLRSSIAAASALPPASSISASRCVNRASGTRKATNPQVSLPQPGV